MTETFRSILRLTTALLAIPPLLLLGACDDDPAGPSPSAENEVAVVLNSVERSLTVIPVDDPAGAYTVAVAPEGTPASLAARGGIAVVPLGTYPFAAVVDLVARRVLHTVALPAGSGATGAAFLNDSIVLVANSDLNSVTPINVLRGDTLRSIAVGVYPQEIVAAGGRAYVLDAQLENFSPARPGTITVIDGSLAPVATIPLAGLNPGSGAFGPDGRLYVVNSGSFGAADGSLSVVDVAMRREIGHHTGFGDFPSGVAVASGRVLVGLYGAGIVEWNPTTGAFARGPADPLTPGGIPPVADIGFDSQGRLFALNPGACDAPGAVYRISAAGAVEAQAATGLCPFSLAFTTLPARDDART